MIDDDADNIVNFCFAEDEGFKPPIPRKGYTGFRVQRIRSLCQSSNKCHAKVIKKNGNRLSRIIEVIVFNRYYTYTIQKKVSLICFSTTLPRFYEFVMLYYTCYQTSDQ